jgi:hypothetical protein
MYILTYYYAAPVTQTSLKVGEYPVPRIPSINLLGQSFIPSINRPTHIVLGHLPAGAEGYESPI